MQIINRLSSAATSAWKSFWNPDDNGENWIPVDHGADLAWQASEEKWLALSAYFACIRNIPEDVGKLPFILYERLKRGKGRASDHKYFNLIRYRPHQAITSASLRETLCRFAIAWGNGYARIYRTNNGNVHSLQPIHAQHVTPNDDGKGGIEYLIKKQSKNEKVIPGKDMIHIHGVGSNGVTGMSVAAYAFQSLTFSGALQTFGTNLYTENGRPAGYLKTAAKLNPDVRKENVKAWKAAHSGRKMGGTAMLDNGLEYHQITVNPSDAQFLETRNFTVEDVARWFRMPLHKIQYLVRAQGWSTLDAQNTDYLTDTLLPWLNRIEDEFTYKLFGGHNEYFCEHMVQALLRGDSRARAEYYVKMFSIGVLTINDILEMENMNPIADPIGDKHFVPLNMTPAEFVKSVSGEQKDAFNQLNSLVPIVGDYARQNGNGNGNGKNRINLGSD